jgi:hypothetical protein
MSSIPHSEQFDASNNGGALVDWVLDGPDTGFR